MTNEALSREAVMEALEQLTQFGVSAAGAARLFDVGNDEFLRYFEAEIFTDLVSTGGATCKIVEGSYGSGKTHLLQLLEDSALERGMAVVRTDLSQSLNLEEWHLIARHILQNIEIRTQHGIVRGLPRVLDALKREGKCQDAALRGASLPHDGFTKAITLRCAHPDLTVDTRELLDRFLEGDRVSTAQLRAGGATGVKHPLSQRNAELVLKTVLAALHRLGVPGTLMLFDESEKTFVFKRQAPSKRILAGANLLRRLIDASANGSLVGTAIVFAVLPDFVSNCGLAYPALGQRLSRVPTHGRASWRWPVLRLDSITSYPDARDFVAALIERHEGILNRFGVNLNGKRQALVDAASDTLRLHVGSDYRRYVVKKVASISLTHFS